MSISCLCRRNVCTWNKKVLAVSRGKLANTETLNDQSCSLHVTYLEQRQALIIQHILCNNHRSIQRAHNSRPSYDDQVMKLVGLIVSLIINNLRKLLSNIPRVWFEFLQLPGNATFQNRFLYKVTPTFSFSNFFRTASTSVRNEYSGNVLVAAIS